MNEGDIHVTVTMPSAIVARARRARCCADARSRCCTFPEVQGRAHRAGPPRGRHRRRGAEPVRDLRDHEARRREWKTGRSKEQIVDADARRAREASRRRLQLQPADQGSRRGVDLRHPRPGGGQDLRRGSARSCTRSSRRCKRILRGVRGARDVEIYRAGSAQHIVADIDREATSRVAASACRTSKDASRAPTAGRLATEIWEGERKVGVRVKLPTPTEGDAARRSAACRTIAGPAAARALSAVSAGQRARRRAGARRSTASREAASWRSSATSRGATWAPSSTRRRPRCSTR